jgi:hypothetical protein
MRSYTAGGILILASALFFQVPGSCAQGRSVAQPAAVKLRADLRLPPLPPDVTELKFKEFFGPIGDRGLTLSPRLQSLSGKRVRIVGYMVRQDEPVRGLLLLSPLPVQLHEREYGLADDLPPAIVFVSVPEARDRILPFTPGLLALTGVLSVGSREEANGRISLVRLTLDPPRPTPSRRSSAAKKPLIRKKHLQKRKD